MVHTFFDVLQLVLLFCISISLGVYWGDRLNCVYETSAITEIRFGCCNSICEIFMKLSLKAR